MEIDPRIANYQIDETPIRLEMGILELVTDIVLAYRDMNSTLASVPSLKDERTYNILRVSRIQVNVIV